MVRLPEVRVDADTASLVSSIVHTDKVQQMLPDIQRTTTGRPDKAHESMSPVQAPHTPPHQFDTISRLARHDPRAVFFILRLVEKVERLNA